MSQFRPPQKLSLFESFCRKNQVDGLEIDAKIGMHPIKLKVAATPESQAKGFMASPEPDENSGLLFVYDTPEPLHFWMKNVSFPLDIVFFDDQMRYLAHQTMLPTSEKDERLIPRYSSPSPARYAVELKSGWCKNKDLANTTLKF